MSRYSDIDPQDLNPATGRPYSGYSSPSLDDSFHQGEMDVDDETPAEALLGTLREMRAEISRVNAAAGETVFNPAATALLDGQIEVWVLTVMDEAFAAVPVDQDDEDEDDGFWSDDPRARQGMGL